MLKVLDEIEPQWDTRVVSLVDNYCRQDGKDYLTVLSENIRRGEDL